MRSSGRLRSRPVRSVSTAIVGQHGADAGENRVGIVADLLHVRAGAFAGDPAGVVLGRGDLAVQRQRGFQRHQREAGAHGMDEGFVQLRGLARAYSDATSTVTAGVVQAAESLAGNWRIGIFHGGDHARHARLHQRVGAGRRAALMRARLQRDVERRAARLLAGLFERENLGVLGLRVGVEPAADYLAVLSPARRRRRDSGWCGPGLGAPAPALRS